MRSPLHRLPGAARALAVAALLAAGATAPAAYAQSPVYDAHCASCHQPNGYGVPYVYPSLVKEAPRLLALDRAYLIRMALYGSEGEREQDGVRYNAKMGAYPFLSDAEIAEALNYTLTQWGNAYRLPDPFVPITAAEVEAQRGLDLDPRTVHDQRPRQDGAAGGSAAP